jgi:transcriptional regulator with XRE-family HTH domain
VAKSFKTLRAKMSPEAQARANEKAQRILAEMPLQDLRKARRMSQEDLASTLGIAQPQISKMEGRTDLYVSTLRRYIEAIGGSLEIVARFEEGSVRINLFGEIEPAPAMAYVFDSGRLALDSFVAYQGAASVASNMVNHPPQKVALSADYPVLQPSKMDIGSVLAEAAGQKGEQKTATDSQLALAA